METEAQFELDLENEEEKLHIRSEIQSVLDAMEGALTAQHFAVLIENAASRGVHRELSEEESMAVKKYAEEAASKTRLDIDTVIDILNPVENQAA